MSSRNRLFPVVHVESCALCSACGPLRESHIIPRFVFEWLVQTSGTGHIRFGHNPNLRMQDGLKQDLLCSNCELMLSAWESETARTVFKPYHRNTGATIKYNGSFAKFCASVCWRVLFIFRGLGLKHFTEEQRRLADGALSRWADFMFSRVRNGDEYELHLLPTGLLANNTPRSSLPSNINRYFTRAIDIDVGFNDVSAFVYIKMCKFIVIGFIQMLNPKHWRGTRVSTRRGTISPRTYAAPDSFLHYILDRARNMEKVLSQLSPTQQKKIAEAMRNNRDRLAASESFAAMSADVAMFGEGVFKK
jgi:hypothetical protein